MDEVVELLTRLGGVATWAQLVEDRPRSAVDQAIAAGRVVRLARGRYALPTGAEARRAAHRLSGVATGRSAAAHHGWSMKWQPRRPSIAVPRGRKVSEALRAEFDVSWRRLSDTEVTDGWVTSPVRTVLDCAASLRFDEALAIADSALASGKVTRAELVAAARRLPNRGRARCLRVIRFADGRSANPFESVLRAIAIEVPALRVVPQYRIDADGSFVARVDLADPRLRIVAEADSFEFHGEREMLERDCERYDRLVVAGWLVLRFSWMQVMKRSAWVRSVLEGAVRRRLAA